MHQETETGGSSGQSSVSTSASLTGASGQLYLAAVSTRSNVAVTSVSGLGLTWTLVQAQCAARAQNRVEVWKAQGSPTGDGVVTANLASSPANAVIAVSRYSGASGAGSSVRANTLGTSGACSGGTDTSAYSVNRTTTVPNSLAYGAAAPRNRTHSPGSGYTERAERAQGTGGDMVAVAVQDKAIPTPAPIAVNGTLSGAADWAVVGVVIQP